MGHRHEQDDEAAFAWFFTSQYPQVVRVLTVVVRESAAAEDLAQEAFIRLHRRWSRISMYESPEAWVRRVALNLSFSWRRREGRRPALEQSHAPTGSPQGSSDLQVDIRRAVAELPKRERALIALYHLEDRPISEVADLLDMSPGAVKVGLHRARARLATVLHDQEITS